MLTNREILALSRAYRAGRIDLGEFCDTLQEHGVTVGRYARVIALDVLRFAAACCAIAAEAWWIMRWVLVMEGVGEPPWPW